MTPAGRPDEVADARTKIGADRTHDILVDITTEGLARRVVSAVELRNADSPIRGVRVHVERAPSRPALVQLPASVYLVLQGQKRITVGDRIFTYGANEIVVVGLDLPLQVEVVDASRERPYVSIEIAVDQSLLREIAAELTLTSAQAAVEAVTVVAMPDSVLRSVARLVDLMPSALDARVLGESAKREILFRVLSSPGGRSLLGLIRDNSVSGRITEVLEWMQRNLAAPIKVDDLARRAAMSPTVFYRNFREASGVTPLQYHKMLRLHEARRLIATRSSDLTRIALVVGYKSPPQFSREYRRLFGHPPSDDVRRARAATSVLHDSSLHENK